jgi:type IV pilus assembly protein PilM
VKFIKLPPVEKKRIPDIVKFEAKQQIPFALEEVVWAYQQIGDKDEDDDEDFSTVEVGLFAMKRDQINRRSSRSGPPGSRSTWSRWARSPCTTTSPSTSSRVGPEGLDRPAGHRGRQHRPDHQRRDADLAAERADRRNHFTRALTKELKLTFAKAEHLKRNATKAPTPRPSSRDAGDLQRLRQRGQPLDRLLLQRQPPGQDPQGGRAGQRVQAARACRSSSSSTSISDVERYESFATSRAKSLPAQFQEYLPRRGGYGLAVQGLGLVALQADEPAPAEIATDRMIRRKKPWALSPRPSDGRLLSLYFALEGRLRRPSVVRSEALPHRAKSVIEAGKAGTRPLRIGQVVFQISAARRAVVVVDKRQRDERWCVSLMM